MKFLGIKVSINWTILIAYALYAGNDLINGSFEKTISFCLLYTFVLIHEYAHALTARKYGFETEEISIHMLGGMAHINSEKANASQNIDIAFAGPKINFIIGGVTLILMLGLSNFGYVFKVNSIMAEISAINIAMGLFNLIPAYPLDGGRIFESTMQLFRIKQERVFFIRRYLSMSIALLFLLTGFWLFSINLIIIGIIIGLIAVLKFSV